MEQPNGKVPNGHAATPQSPTNGAAAGGAPQHFSYLGCGFARCAPGVARVQQSGVTLGRNLGICSVPAAFKDVESVAAPVLGKEGTARAPGY